ncbi:MAG: hypothetical protein JNL67_19995 [Planctomycetaceae bacterium]|nr:hypothetical protein [Planctomycetaceae bacterium]
MVKRIVIIAFWLGFWSGLGSPHAAAQDVGSKNAAAQPAPAEHAPAETATVDPDLISKLEKYLSGATLKGRYTVLGKDIPPADEEYTIESAEKLPEGDLWLIKARIKYGKWDVTVPLTIPIKWADKTPVITLEKFTIPGMGTFSARVLFNNEMYSGTWSHDDVRGQLFGQVIPAKSAESEPSPNGNSK